jgi:hypothetical protein
MSVFFPVSSEWSLPLPPVGDSDPIRNFPFSSEDVIQIFDNVSTLKQFNIHAIPFGIGVSEGSIHLSCPN